jgi:CMP-N,N'-diacetyllegionaminic acid synthase
VIVQEKVLDVVAIIPARGGSKGIPRKNLSAFRGKPLIVSSIEHALASKLISRVLVSTDDPAIRAIAVENGAEAPFLRPKELAQDHVLDQPVFKHALDFLGMTGYAPDMVVHLRPTAPYRKAEWIDDAIKLMWNRPDADSVRSVSEPDKHPYRMFTIDDYGFLSPIMKNEHPTPYLLRRQDLPKIYYYNCVIDVTRPEIILDKCSMTGDKILPYIMNPDDVIDIDTPRDLEIARFLFEGK